MLTFKSLLLIGFSLVAAASNSACQGGVYAVIASDLAGFPPATAYCSANFPVTGSTSTVTAPTTTITTTVATSTATTTVATATVTSTVATTTTTSTASTATTTVTVSTETDTVSITISTSTETDTVTQTTTTTSTSVTVLSKRQLAARSPNHPTSTTTTKPSTTITKPPSKTPTTTTTKPPSTTTTTKSGSPQSSQWSSLLSEAKSFIGAVCTCLENPQTTTITTTPSAYSSVTTTVTSSVTSTTTSSVTDTETATTTATSTVSATATISVTSSITPTITSFTTTTSTATVTTSSTSTYRGPACNDPGNEVLGAGGCSSNCYCEFRDESFTEGVCTTTNAFLNGEPCVTDDDCDAGTACAADIFNILPECLSFEGCTSTYLGTKKRSLFEGFPGWNMQNYGARMAKRKVQLAAAEAKRRNQGI